MLKPLSEVAWEPQWRMDHFHRKVNTYLWKRADLVCEHHFAPDCFDQINGTFASDPSSKLEIVKLLCLQQVFSPGTINQCRCPTNTCHVYTLNLSVYLQQFQISFLTHWIRRRLFFTVLWLKVVNQNPFIYSVYSGCLVLCKHWQPLGLPGGPYQWRQRLSQNGATHVCVDSSWLSHVHDFELEHK